MSMRGGGGRGRPGFKKEKPEFDQHIVDLARVTRVTKGGKQMSFRALVLIGDHKGRVGYGVEKGKDVQLAVQKAANQAKKNLITVPIIKDTVPHRVEAKYKAARVMIKPAPRGSGIIAGGAMRIVLEMAGVPNASAKILGKTGNKMNNVKATFDALQSFKRFVSFKAKKDILTEAEDAIVRSLNDHPIITKADEGRPSEEVDTLKKKPVKPQMVMAKKWPVKR